jgi:hypothetical protein
MTKHSIKTTILLISILFLYNSAIASDWMLVGDYEESSYYIDKDSINKKDNEVTYWDKNDYKEIQTNDGIKFKSSSSFIHMDCKEKTWGFTKVVNYDSEGRIVSSQDYPLELRPIVSGSRTETWYKLVCK